jgi:hypothetical protein
MLQHVVLISFHEDTPERVRDMIFEKYQTLAEDCGGTDAGILSWQVEKNLDRRKNIHLVQFATFRDNDALQAFRSHPGHKRMVDILAKFADWYVGDLLS